MEKYRVVEFKIERKGNSWSYCFLGEDPHYFKNYHTLINHLTTVYWMFFPKYGDALFDLEKRLAFDRRYGYKQREVIRFNTGYEHVAIHAYPNKYYKKDKRMEITKILLDNKFHDKVINGTKKQTIRYGKRDYPLGDAVFEGYYKPTYIDITALEYKKYKNLTEEDAILDGFKNLQELKDVLEGFYSDIEDESDITLVKFDYKEKKNG